jgi:hypothetical protein
VANLAGKTYGLTAFTRMKPWRTWGVRAVFLAIVISLIPLPRWLTRRLTWTPLGKVRRVQDDLMALSFIHFARWVIIPRDGFPRLAPEQPRENLSYDYLFFESNFNGDWEKYIGAFSQVIPGGMDNIWRWSVKYPMSRPIGPFLKYIRNAQYDTDYYYSAYPGASTNDIRGALRLQQELDAFAASSESLAPVEFAAAYQRFCIRVQNCIGRTGPPPFPATLPGVKLPVDARVPAVASPVQSTVSSRGGNG